MRHLMNVLDLSVDEINQLISLAETIIEDPTRYSEVCKGKKLATCLYEPSTRTRLSFESSDVGSLGGQRAWFFFGQIPVLLPRVKALPIRSGLYPVTQISAAMRHPKEGAASGSIHALPDPCYQCGRRWASTTLPRL